MPIREWVKRVKYYCDNVLLIVMWHPHDMLWSIQRKMNFKVSGILILYGSFVTCDILSTISKNKVKLPPCDVCKSLVRSFKKGIERTSRGNFAGGDAAWEEEKLGSYYRSEVRLVEIQEKLCLDVQEAESQCHSLAEEAEYLLEEWWFKKQDSDPDLEKWLCILNMKLCCEPGHYGPDCEQCPGFPDKICSGNGKCKGSGTRSGSGKCSCNVGFDGEYCERCAVKYFEIYDKGKLTCSPCHVSCESECSDGTPKGCKSCRPGWQMDPQAGCMDVDECKILKDVCKNNEVCINTEGSYLCRDISQAAAKDPGKWVRYVTYVTFLIATGIFLRKSILLGSFVGVIAAIYISASEIVMNDYMDVSKLEFKQVFGKS